MNDISKSQVATPDKVPPLGQPQAQVDVGALCTEAQITRLVHEFYARVRQDAALGPVFNTHVKDWDSHLSNLVDFWSAVLLHTSRFRGTPMPKHMALPELSAELFDRWLVLFRDTARNQENQAMARQASEMAGRIAQSLWMGYQMTLQPEVIPAPLSRATPVTPTVPGA